MFEIPFRYYKFVRLGLNLFAWFAMGAMNEILSPTLPDLSLRVNADYAVMGRTVALRMVGNFFTPLLAGLLYDRFPRSREVAFGFIFIAGGAMEIAVPYSRSVGLLSLLLILQGISEGAVITAGQSMIIELFAGQASSALQFMHLGWGVGSFLANQIVRPFLAPNLILSKGKVHYACDLEQSLTTNATAVDNSESRIEVAFLIIGLYAIFMGIVLFVFSLLPKPKRPDDTDSNANAKRNLREMLSPAVISDGKPLFGWTMLMGLLIIYIADVGSYVAFTRYLVTVAIDPCKGFRMTQSDATLLQSCVALSFSLARIVSGVLFAFLIAKDHNPGVVILACTLGMSVAIVLYGCIGLQFEAGYWVLSCAFAFFHAPLYGGTTPWFNQYIRLTSTVIAIAVTGSNIGKFFLSWFSGFLLKSYGSSAHLYSLIPVVIVLLVTVIVCFVVSVRVGRRPTFRTPQKTKESDTRDEADNASDQCLPKGQLSEAAL